MGSFETQAEKKVTIILVLFYLYYIIGIFWTIPLKVHCEYKGIKFQTGNPSDYQTVTFIIEGQYKKRFFPIQEADQFEGTIKIKGEGVSYDSDTQYYGFGSNRWNVFNWGTTKGTIHASQSMKEIVLSIHDTHSSIKGTSSGSYTAWYIAGPAETREQALNITNKYLKKQYGYGTMSSTVVLADTRVIGVMNSV